MTWLPRVALLKECQISLKKRKLHWKKCNLEFRKCRIKDCEWSKIPEKCAIKDCKWWLWFRKCGIKECEFWTKFAFFNSAFLFRRTFSTLLSSLKVWHRMVKPPSFFININIRGIEPQQDEKMKWWAICIYISECFDFISISAWGKNIKLVYCVNNQWNLLGMRFEFILVSMIPYYFECKWWISDTPKSLIPALLRLHGRIFADNSLRYSEQLLLSPLFSGNLLHFSNI